MKRHLCIVLLALSPLPAGAQYWADYLLEKGFDPRNYFLRPHRILSVQLKNLDAGLLGIRPDPLSEMSFQPAVLSSMSGTRLYIDLKGSSEKPQTFKYRVYPTYFYENSRFAPTYWAQPAERKLEALVSAIYLGDVAAKYLPGFKYALSYELIHHQGTFYEYVPFWYYGAYDAFGVKDAASRNFPELEVNVKRDGLDEKTETAHLMDGYLSLKLAKFLSVGAKVGRVQTDIAGDYLRLNNYDDQSNQNYRSSYLNEKGTGTSLRQYELAAGVLLSISETRQLGFFAGQIEGDHQQSANDRDSSFYSWGASSQADYFSRWRYSHNDRSNWEHEGITRFAGMHGELPMHSNVAFRFRLEYQESAIDLTNGDTVVDTSYGHYRFRYYEDNRLYDSISSSRFTQNRAGEGTEDQVHKSVSAGLVVPLYKENQMVIGLHAQSSESDVLMYEDVRLRRASHQETATPWRPVESVIGIEDKTLRLTQSKTTTRLALPVAISFHLGYGWAVHFGAIKQFTKIEQEEVIDIWFRTDSTVVIRPPGVTVTSPPDRIDRYIAVPVHRSDSSTDFRFGISFQPSRRLRLDAGMGASPTDLESWQFAFVLSL